MGFSRCFVLACGMLMAGQQAVQAKNCDNPDNALGVYRTQIVDTTAAPHFGTFQYPDRLGLQPGEVVLTFDDGPHPQLTDSILAALKKHCTKATFFPVGMMARAYPEVVRRVALAGHTIGSHTYRHANFQRTGFMDAKKQVETGFATVSRAAGMPIAPFFRYPGLRHTKQIGAYLAQRDIAVFSVDIISGDTDYKRADTILRNVLSRLKRDGKGILLFHDLKKATARLLPRLLDEIKARGYKVVHLVPKRTLRYDAPIVAEALENPVATAVHARIDRFTPASQVAVTDPADGDANQLPGEVAAAEEKKETRKRPYRRRKKESIHPFWAHL